MLTNEKKYIIISLAFEQKVYGGVAQLARANGSYPLGRWFKSTRRYHLWPDGQAVKTPPFHGGIGGSIPPRVTRKKHFERSAFFNEVFLMETLSR